MGAQGFFGFAEALASPACNFFCSPHRPIYEGIILFLVVVCVALCVCVCVCGPLSVGPFVCGALGVCVALCVCEAPLGF